MNFLTELREGLAISWAAIRANKLRSVLTTLGIVIGIVTVTLMGTAIEGLNRAFVKSISFIGADVRYLDRRPWFIDSYEEWRKSQRNPTMTLAEVEGLEKQLTLASAITPFAVNEQAVKYQRRSASTAVMGTTENMMLTMGFTI